jgi:hypothetical protein
MAVTALARSFSNHKALAGHTLTSDPAAQPLRDSPLSEETLQLQARLKELKLSNSAIEKREEHRIKAARAVAADAARVGVTLARQIHDERLPWFITGPYKLLCWLL